MSLLLVELLAFAVQIVRFTPVHFKERIKNLLCHLEVLAIRFGKLLEESHGWLSIFVLELWIDLEAGLKESVVALLQVLWKSMIQCLQLESILLWFLLALCLLVTRGLFDHFKVLLLLLGVVFRFGLEEVFLLTGQLLFVYLLRVHLHHFLWFFDTRRSK